MEVVIFIIVVEGLNIFYSYIVSFLLVIIVVASAIMARG